MKTIGIIGGMSWVSTQDYYRYINEMVAERLGGSHSAEILLRSVDFAPIEAMQEAEDWDGMGEHLAQIAKRLEAAGAACILIATNTMHNVAPAVEAAISIPLLHIADTTAAAVKEQGLQTVALLGTRYTMEKDFLYNRFVANGLNVVRPSFAERKVIHDIIYAELVKNQFTDASRAVYVEIIDDLRQRGAEGMLLACTEIPMLVKPSDTAVPLFDTVYCHAKAAVEFALATEEKPQPPALADVFGGESVEGWGSAVFIRPKSDTIEATARSIYQAFAPKKFARFGEAMWQGWKQSLAVNGAVEDIFVSLTTHDDFQLNLQAAQLVEAHDDPIMSLATLNDTFADPAITDLHVYTIGDGNALAGVLIIAERATDYIALVSLLD